MCFWGIGVVSVSVRDFINSRMSAGLGSSVIMYQVTTYCRKAYSHDDKQPDS